MRVRVGGREKVRDGKRMCVRECWCDCIASYENEKTEKRIEKNLF